MASLRAYIGAYMIRSRVRGPLARARSAADFRRIFETPAFPDPKGVTYESGTVGGVRGEWVRPKAGPGRRMLYIHGGGFIACSPRTHRPVTGALANRGFTIFAPDYRLAPEHPFPAALEDVMAVWRAFSAEGAACVAGESAGGNLALVLMGEAKARNLPMPWAAALFSPATDFVSETGSRVTNAWRDAMFDPKALAEIRTMYLGNADPADPGSRRSTATRPGSRPCCSMWAAGRCCATIPCAWPNGPGRPGSRRSSRSFPSSPMPGSSPPACCRRPAPPSTRPPPS